ncbi:protein LYRIC-like [Gadus macrocephalus]|uniref:protein LYRIC-like n=1 Tax=Gadus macrocephalus TaxID=80720 RepID=UPI0028CBBC50|nr:protein LYRIC-like [Gadus macrocephalus]
MENFQEATSRQVKLLTSRLKEALSSGLELLHSELGVDLGLKPELIPPWVILLAACIGLVLLVALWASACGFLFKRRPAAVDGGYGVKPDGIKPAVKTEDQKKKKKKTEKKAQEAQPNGRAVPEALEEATVSEEIVPHHQSPPPQGKTESATEVKKSKKKAKQVVKVSKTATADGKEPEEGTWETKVSNKEKREQRKKEKTPSDGSASPGGGNTSNGSPQELPKPAPVQVPAAQKKKKGEITKVKVEKVEAVATQVVRSSEPTSSSTKAAVNAPAHTAAQAPGHWAAKREPATLWGSEIDGSWTVIESGMKTSDQTQVSSFSGLGAAEPIPDQPWAGQPKVEDEWSGQNGGTVDASSDWNAPSEVWGNYEEPAPSPPAAQKVAPPEPAKVHLLMEAADDEDDDKADSSGKTKKRKKKKRKVAEEGGQGSQDSEEPEKEVVHEAPVKKPQQPAQEKAPAVQPAKTAAAATEARVERPVKETVSQKTPVTQVPQKPSESEPTAQQKKIEESQAPKPVKKKKARRET